MGNLNLNRLRIFAEVVDSGSLTNAATRLGMTRSVVSSHIQRLEQEVGGVLLLRTTRKLSLTSMGERLAASCRIIMGELDAALRDLDEESHDVYGPLRITSSIDYGARVVSPVLTALAIRYPGLRIELIASDSILDPVEAKLDVAIRLGWLRDASQYASRIGEFRQLLVGSPDWLKNNRQAFHPSALEGWPMVALSILGQKDRWDFIGPEGNIHQARFTTNLSMSTTSAVRASVLAGGGLAVLPDYLVSEDIVKGSLVHLLPKWNLPLGGIFAVTQTVKLRQKKVQVFLEALRAHISVSGIPDYSI